MRVMVRAPPGPHLPLVAPSVHLSHVATRAAGHSPLRSEVRGRGVAAENPELANPELQPQRVTQPHLLPGCGPSIEKDSGWLGFPVLLCPSSSLPAGGVPGKSFFPTGV